MAENENPPSNSKTSGFKNLIIVALTTLLITGGLVATFSNYLKDLFIRKTTTYTINLILRNGPAGNLPGIIVKLNSATNHNSDSTDNYGSVIFEVKKDVHKIIFSFGNKAYVRNCSIVSDTTLIIDIGISLTSLETGETVKSSLPQPDKKVNQKKVTINSDVVKITSTQKDVSISTTVTQPKTTTDTPANKPVEVRSLTTNEILQQLQLQVKIDKSDSYRNRGEQFAYRYYLSGKKEYLDQVDEVLYQRNHSTFPEFKNNRFNVSDERTSNFEYVGYQWGSIPNTYILIILKNGLKSDIFLKDIVYQ